MNDVDRLKDYARQLKLSHIKNHVELHLEEAKTHDVSHVSFLQELFEKELETRRVHSTEKRLKQARFPTRKHLEDFDRDRLTPSARKKLKEVATLGFLEEGENLLIMGNPGVGKTHIAIALGVQACLEGKKVLFANAPNLLIELRERTSTHQLTKYKNRFVKYDLVIIDELGYISFDKEGAQLFFNLLSARSETKSLIITSNLAFERWDEIFEDPVLTNAMIDRLVHKAHLLDLFGIESYRTKETKEWLESDKTGE